MKVVSKALHNDREDMKQEIRMKILEKVKTLDDLEAPGFLEFISENE